MKTLSTILVSILFIFSLSSCGKTSTVMLNERVDTAAVLKLQGPFMGIGSEQVSGQAKIYLQNGKYSLALGNFSTTNGSDLKVYLSQKAEPYNFIKLGDLKSTNGNQLYELAGMPDFNKV